MPSATTTVFFGNGGGGGIGIPSAIGFASLRTFPGDEWLTAAAAKSTMRPAEMVKIEIAFCFCMEPLLPR